METILGPGTPVYSGDSTGTKFTSTGWFPDACFGFLWGGANEPDTNLSWWMDRHSGSSVLDCALHDGVWISAGPYYSPDARGYWIQTIYRPVDVDPSLRGTTVSIDIYPNSDGWSTTTTPQNVTIDDNYLVAFAHIEGYKAPGSTQTANQCTIYSTNNGRNWLKGPLRGLGLTSVDKHTNPSVPRLTQPGFKSVKYTTDIATGVNGYTTFTTTYNKSNVYGMDGVLWPRYLSSTLSNLKTEAGG